MTTATTQGVDPDVLAEAVAAQIADGGRFAGLAASALAGGATAIDALVAGRAGLVRLRAQLPASHRTYPSLTPLVPAAAWYEREIHDLFGLVPVGHPRLDPLVLPLADSGSVRPRPGSPDDPGEIQPDHAALPPHVRGHGLFTLPYGPVRSGVFETVEYLLETFGEDIPHLHTRVHHKHRGIERRFGDLALADGVLLAERVEGTVSVAHASALCQAVEAIAGVEPPQPAQLLRVAHAELERIAHHLDSMVRHSEGAGQAVAFARLTTHKEKVLRLRARLCGSRFGRGVIVPGGASGPPLCPVDDFLGDLAHLSRSIASDVGALMATPSFLDRLRSTGIVSPEVAAAHGALGPVGRGSDLAEDVRVSRPYGAYRVLDVDPAPASATGDALARQQVRVHEIVASVHLVEQALHQLKGSKGPWRVEGAWTAADGSALGWAEAPQGELLYLVTMEGGRLVRVKPRTASFHNLALFSSAFRGDIFTDFAFIEASFGLSIAGVAG